MNARTLLLAMSSAAVLLSGCRQDMQNQPKYIPLRAADPQIWQDGRSARMPVANTVAHTELRDDTYYYSGKVNGQPGGEFPTQELIPAHFKDMSAVLERGQQRFNIYCSPCHSRVGDGNGMIPQRGLKHPPSFHEDRLKKMPIGHFYDVMTGGFGSMLNYAAQIRPEDRWAIAAYIRALQLSQDAQVSDVPADQRNNVQDFSTLEQQFNDSISTSPERRLMYPPGAPSGGGSNAQAGNPQGVKK